MPKALFFLRYRIIKTLVCRVASVLLTGFYLLAQWKNRNHVKEETQTRVTFYFVFKFTLYQKIIISFFARIRDEISL